MKISEKIKLFLKKYPSLNRVAKKTYEKFVFLKESLTKVNITEKEEKKWEERHLREGQDWAIKDYWDVHNHPATLFLVDKIEKYLPFSSVLEIGSNCGPNLFALAKKLPKNIKIKGVDINPAAIKTGNELLRKEGILNVELLVGKAYDLSRFSDKSFDIVFSKAVLCHIGPARISKVVEEMVRVAQKNLILVEYYCSSKEDPTGQGARLGHSHRWKRDYKILLNKFAPKAKINFTKIPKELWGAEWGEVGYFIEVVL